jgi:glucose-6-phosphate 1-dehydrogenase
MNTNKPLTIVIFGATGDLYKYKISQALFGLYEKGLLPPNFSIIAFARRDMDDASFRSFTALYLPQSATDFVEKIFYIQGAFDNPTDYRKLYDYKNKIFYVATPPVLYETILNNLSKSGVALNSKILLEKPFGGSSSRAHYLNDLIQKLGLEKNVLRVDHYLYKNNLVHIKNEIDKIDRSKIKKIKIILNEIKTIGSRGTFYDKIGAFLDVGQNHMLEVFAMITCGEGSERTDILKNIILQSEIIRAQYDGYVSEEGVSPKSETETFFNIKLKLDLGAWREIVFELESGKGLSKNESSVIVYFTDGRTITHTTSIDEDNSYEQVFYSAITGRNDLFVSGEENAEEWRIYDEVKKSFAHSPLLIYKKGANPQDIK